MKKIIILLFICVFISGCLKKTEVSIKPITTKEVYNNINTGKYVILDVREDIEYNEGHISSAINISVDYISSEIEKMIANKDFNIVVYCRGGSRSLEASKKLLELGYTNVYDMGGIVNWEYGLVK